MFKVVLVVFHFFTFSLVLSQNHQVSYLFGGRNCGHRPPPGIIAHVYGGRNVTEGEMPWLVRLTTIKINSKTERCGGFIVDANWIVTAAHCLTEVAVVNVSAGRISYGWGSSDANEQAMIVPTTGIHRHPDFEEATYRNDIGLLHLPRPLRFTSHVQPICVLDEASCENEPREDSDQIDFCPSIVTAAGWGIDRSGSPTDYLKTVNLRIISKNDCQPIFSPRQLYPQQICAQGQLYGEETCRGDSGGPVFCFQNGKAVAIATVSFGSRFCDILFPSGYHRVCSYVGWMKRVVANSVSSNGCQIPSERLGHNLTQISNGIQLREEDIVPFGTLVNVSCVSGFEQTFETHRSVCTTERTWVPSIGYCRPIVPTTKTIPTTTTTTPVFQQCPDPPHFANARVVAGQNHVGSERVVICNEGFQSLGSLSFRIYCLRNLLWSNTGKCEMSTNCGEPPNVENAIIPAGSTSIGAQRIVICTLGYNNVKFGTLFVSITCLPSLQWSDPGRCEMVPSPTISSSTIQTTTTTETIRRQCQDPPSFSNAKVLPGQNHVGSQRVVNCSENFSIKGSQSAIIQCQNNLEWSNPGNCERICSDLPSVANGLILFGSSDSDSIRLILCQLGFTLVGTSTISCLADGQWSTPGSCQTMQCPSEVPQIRNGIISPGSRDPGSSRHVSCLAGYALHGSNVITCSNSGQWSAPGNCTQGLTLTFYH